MQIVESFVDAIIEVLLVIMLVGWLDQARRQHDFQWFCSPAFQTRYSRSKFVSAVERTSKVTSREAVPSQSSSRGYFGQMRRRLISSN